MAHTIQNKTRLLARVKRMKGQMDALGRALESEADCSAVLQQIAAIRGAANGLMGEVLEGHLRDHLGADASDAGERARDVEQIATVLRTYLK